MKFENKLGCDLLCLFFIFVAVGDPISVIAQDIPGELIFEEPCEGDELMPGWYMVQNNDATAERLGMLEDGPNGGDALVIFMVTPDTVAMNNVQFSNDSIVRPEGSDIYDWRITFWFRTQVVPFTIRPIIAMAVDPWSGTSDEVVIETAEEWVFIDVTLPAGDFLTTDNLILIFHMGNPGDENWENEVWFDDIKVYLLNQDTAVTNWSLH